jgi:membrane protease YdiL (CAAX protease family)
VAWDPAAAGPARVEPAGLPGVGIALLGYIIGLALAFALEALMWALGRPGGRPAVLAISELGLWSGFLGACWAVSRRRGTGSLRQDFGLSWRPIDIGFGLAASIVGRVAAAIAVLPLYPLLRNVDQPNRDVFDPVVTSTGGWVVLIAVTCVGAPVVEELFFRGLVQTRLIGRWGAARGILVTSLLFGAAHLTGWQGPITFVFALAIAAGGVVLGSVRYLTGRLGTSMATHVFFNAQAMAILALAVSR